MRGNVRLVLSGIGDRALMERFDGPGNEEIAAFLNEGFHHEKDGDCAYEWHGVEWRDPDGGGKARDAGAEAVEDFLAGLNPDEYIITICDPNRSDGNYVRGSYSGSAFGDSDCGIIPLSGGNPFADLRETLLSAFPRERVDAMCREFAESLAKKPKSGMRM